MRVDFQFSNLCGTVYTKGNLVFHPDGDRLLSPVGNRVSVFDLRNGRSITLPFENRKNIERLALSPNGVLLITVDEEGRALLVNLPRRAVLHHHNFGGPVRDLQFSPDGKYFLVSHGREVRCWRSPGTHREFVPLVLYRSYAKHTDDVVSLAWSPDSRFFLTCSEDMTVRVWSLDPEPDFVPASLAAHRDTVVAAFWAEDGRRIYSVSRDGAVFVWHAEDVAAVETSEDASGEDEGASDPGLRKRPRSDGAGPPAKKRWRIAARHYFNMQHARVRSVSFHAASSLLAVGFSSGAFGLWELPSFTQIHTLSVSQKRIDAAAVSPTGEWIAFASSKLGQLLVWEWRSETHVLKQQGHGAGPRCLAWSADGGAVATGGDDGKVKVWDSTSGFCYVTFSEHAGAVSRVDFAKAGQALFSASLDGTVRAYDLIRYRNFRTFTSPRPAQFCSLAVDPSGEIVCAGSADTFEIFVWSVQTGRLVEVLAGHEGPVWCLAFDPSGSGRLYSGSWDKTVRVWDIFSRSGTVESLGHQSDVLAIAVRPDGKELAVSTLDGQVTLWDPAEASQTGTIEGRKDLQAGRKSSDRTTAANAAAGKHFTSLCYSADGTCLLAGGNAKNVCIYDLGSRVMLKRFRVSSNLSLDGMLEKLNSKNLAQGVPLDMIDDVSDDEDLEDRMDQSLPGVQRGDRSVRKTRPEIRVSEVRFAPTGRAWAAAATEGLLVYSLDEVADFDPFDLELEITPAAIAEAAGQREYLRALVMAFRLGERSTQSTVYHALPVNEVPLLCRDMPVKYLGRTLELVSWELNSSPRLEFHLTWVNSLLRYHGFWLKDHASGFLSTLRALQKHLIGFHDDLSRTCDENSHALDYLLYRGQMS
ncbi:quinon protein alcohol dehydrogenase-like superfamily [Hyaloraphidium curvatum]|nr:quinon protein alcohol dehydrogenase-like superfamily [Hyaloraphidium curvatum]